MLCAVVDIGKTHARLVLLDEHGQAAAQVQGASASVATAGGWPALDTAATEHWLFDALASLGSERARLRHLVVTTHGAAVAALAGETLALPVPDYEFEGFGETAAETLAGLDPFDDTLSPVLPRGLNLGLQLDWLTRHEPAALARADTLLPYPQYWAWRLCDERASEVSSLGCHTLLWRPRERRFSDWAIRRGWAARFAPLRAAWDTLGVVRPKLARGLSLPESLQVHTGVHDSNACLARWLRDWPRLTVVSTGTWVVVMAPGALCQSLDADADELGNVSVRNEVVPTARFMGGREFAALCAGADPALADPTVLRRLLARQLRVLPAFAGQGGPYRAQADELKDASGAVALDSLAPAERATLASLYVAQVTASIIERLGSAPPVLLEGPFAHNPVIVEVLAALLPAGSLHTVADAVEGTVRGAAMLAQWTTRRAQPEPPAAVAAPGDASAIQAHHRRWLLELRERAGALARGSG
jgi:sugar (pentulose or hexulose) kinase